MLPDVLRRLSCNPALRRVGHRLHVNHLIRHLYCHLLSASGELGVSCLGVNAVFRASNSRQLAIVDYIVTSERDTIEAALSNLRAGDTFLDVGSHYGIFTILASKLVGPAGRVIAVEPHSESVQVLRRNLAANRCENVEVLNVGFSDTAGPLALDYNANFAVVQSLSDPRSTRHVAQGVAGDEALRNAPVPAAVKVDVEGHEYAVLCGLKRTLSGGACRRLCLEIHPLLLPSGVNKDTIMRFIRSCGFNVLSESARSAEVHVVAAR